MCIKGTCGLFDFMTVGTRCRIQFAPLAVLWAQAGGSTLPFAERIAAPITEGEVFGKRKEATIKLCRDEKDLTA